MSELETIKEESIKIKVPAFQWQFRPTRHSNGQMPSWVKNKMISSRKKHGRWEDNCLKVKTKDGEKLVRPGDFLILDEEGITLKGVTLSQLRGTA